MPLPLIVLSAAVTIALVLVATLGFELSFGRAALLAPVLVLSFGALVGLVLLWTRVALESVRKSR